MSAHPDVDQLFALASATNDADAGLDSVRSHVKSCLVCQESLLRLRAGSALLEEARIETPDEPDWSAMDAAIAKAAEETASAIRKGTLKPKTRWRDVALVGSAFAAAAAGVFAWRINTRPVVEAPPVVATRPETPQTTTVPTAARYEARVLLSAGGARVVPTGATETRVAALATLTEGARLTTTSEGRAVLGLESGWKLDVRGGSVASLDALREGRTAVEVTSGEVALVHDGVATTPAVIGGHGWRVSSEGTTVAQWQSHAMRVVILAGHSTVTREGASPMQVTGPVVLDLPDTGEGTVAAGPAVDGNALNLSALRVESSRVEIPTLVGVTAITLAGVSLPPNLEAICVRTPATLIARTAHGRMTLELGGAGGWQRAPMVASAAPTPRVVAVPVVTPTPAPVVDEARPSQQQVNLVGRAAGARVNHCVWSLTENNRIRTPLHASIQLEVPPSGPVRVAQIDGALEPARACVTREAMSIQAPRYPSAYVIELPFHRE